MLLVIAVVPGLNSCSDEADDEYNGVEINGTGSLTLQFNHFFGSKPLKYAPDSFFSAAGDTIKITKLAYYISNITLENEAGAKTNLNTYQLINEGVSSTKTITLSNIPPDKYKSISFVLGIDSIRNHSGVQDGDLDPAYGMFWTWNTGYIFFRLIGRFGKSDKPISYDVGGDNHSNIFKFPLTGAKVKSNQVQMQLNMDVAEFFTGPYIINLQQDVHEVHSGTDTQILPRLYQNMKDIFTLTNIQ
jgi:hypothetical protein